jgi:hypothetical protein
MCTAVIEVPEKPGGAVRLLAVRDENPARAWDAPGRWWPHAPDIIGVRDRVAGGAWFAASSETGRMVLVLNRAADSPEGLPEGPSPLESRGTLVLNVVTGGDVTRPPRTSNFNLVSIDDDGAQVTTWNGTELRQTMLTPGIHMIAHHDVDDTARTPRIAHWLPEFQALAGLADHAWRTQWLALLEASAQLASDDDRAIVRDNRTHGYDTRSLLYCLTESVPAANRGVQPLTIDSAVFAVPGHWQHDTVESVQG